jgi:hypothetical protein
MSSRTAAGRARAKFFCDHCGAEVPLEAASCPRCERPFSSVRCPRCGFAGPPRSFAAGCPSCGYAGGGGAAGKPGGTRSARPRLTVPGRPRAVLPRRFYMVAAVGLSVILLASILLLVQRLLR